MDYKFKWYETHDAELIQLLIGIPFIAACIGIGLIIGHFISKYW